MTQPTTYKHILQPLLVYSDITNVILKVTEINQQQMFLIGLLSTTLELSIRRVYRKTKFKTNPSLTDASAVPDYICFKCYKSSFWITENEFLLWEHVRFFIHILSGFILEINKWVYFGKCPTFTWEQVFIEWKCSNVSNSVCFLKGHILRTPSGESDISHILLLPLDWWVMQLQPQISVQTQRQYLLLAHMAF